MPDTSAPSDAELLARFRPVFQRIAANAVARERERRLAHEELRWLRDAGFGALRVPVEHGGSGVTLTQLFTLLIELAEAESNLPQALRTHFAFVEERLRERDTERGKRWLRAVGDGAIFGNATSERGDNALGEIGTRLSPGPDGLRLNGTKFYSTGSLYADHLTVVARHSTGSRVQVITRSDAPGVRLVDDYTGFGQRLSASGTSTFTDVLIDPDDVIEMPETGYHGHRLAFLQLVQLAGLAGIAQRAAGDAADFVRRRRRTYAHGNADLPSQDPLVQQVVGRVDSAAFTARATVLAAAASLDTAASPDTAISPDTAVLAEPEHPDSAPDPRTVRAEIDVYRTQVTVIELVLRATSELFDVGGSSVVDEELRLDRHWRNARTLAVHNPVVYKQRIVGDHVINGTVPEILPFVGVPRSLAGHSG